MADYVVDDFDARVERATSAGAQVDRPVLRHPDLGDMVTCLALEERI